MVNFGSLHARPSEFIYDDQDSISLTESLHSIKWVTENLPWIFHLVFVSLFFS